MGVGGLTFGNVGSAEVVSWWERLDTNGASSVRGPDGKIFLYGYVSDDSGGKVKSSVEIDSPDTEVIFPLISSDAETQSRARDDIDTKVGDDKPYAYLRINGRTIDGSKFRRVAHSLRSDRHFDGLWVNVKGLTKGDFIEFGGDGPRSFWTEAEYKVVEP
jgi:hypothetical protein